VLFDQPNVVAHADPVLRAGGIADRCQVVGGNFFEAVPPGGDAYILKNVLGNWDDDRAAAIQRACRRAMGTRGTLLAIQAVVDPPNEGDRGKFTDVNMLVMEAGRQRTPEEFAALFASAEFRLENITATTSEVSVVEGRAA
jgi:hypothetical protein